jgi:Protein of unknown function (DUF3379)
MNMMSCLEFHRRITIDPGDRDPGILQHAAACAPCAAFGQRLARLDRSLHAAIDVEAPREMSARILLRQSCTERRAARARRRRWLALAASVVVIAGIAGGYWSYWQQDSLSQAVLAHVDEEPFALSPHSAIPVENINEIAQPMQTWIDGSLGTVSFAKICPIHDAEGVHLVVEGDEGPVTVMILPHETIHHEMTVRNERYEGVIVPRAIGSIAIVGYRGEPLDDVEARVRTAVHQFRPQLHPI